MQKTCAWHSFLYSFPCSPSFSTQFSLRFQRCIVFVDVNDNISYCHFCHCTSDCCYDSYLYILLPYFVIPLKDDEAIIITDLSSYLKLITKDVCLRQFKLHFPTALWNRGPFYASGRRLDWVLWCIFCYRSSLGTTESILVDLIYPSEEYHNYWSSHCMFHNL